MKTNLTIEEFNKAVNDTNILVNSAREQFEKGHKSLAANSLSVAWFSLNKLTRRIAEENIEDEYLKWKNASKQ